MTKRPHRAKALVGRVLFLLVLTLVGVGGSAIGMGPIAAAGTSVGPQRAHQNGVRGASRQVTLFAESNPRGTSESARARVVDPGSTTPTGQPRWRSTRAASRGWSRPSPVELRVPERGPPPFPVTR